MTEDDKDMLIAKTVAEAVVIIRSTFNLSSGETSELIDTIYDMLIKFSVERKK